MEGELKKIEDIRIAAVVATHNRPYDLANRSLRSIENQTKQPDYLIVVDDSDPKYRRINENIKTDFASRWTKSKYLGNYRTPGVSGAWNTALAWLYSNAKDVYIAILDDDDCWEKTYLEKCSKAVSKNNLDMVVAGIIRHDDESLDGRPQSIPKELNTDDFFEGNPHIQGSNLFIKLKTILYSGCFDESLVSTTDRDLCIRLADLSFVKYGIIDEHLVHHSADSSRSRLSSFGSETKRRGLSQFYKKYGPRMTNSQRQSFFNRCQELFGCDITDEDIVTSEKTIPTVTEIDDELKLLIGIISSTQIDAIKNLLNDLNNVKIEHKNTDMVVLILENSGKDEACLTGLRNIINNFQHKGLEIKLLDYNRQKEDILKWGFNGFNIKNIERKSIASSRTMLQHYLYLESQVHPGAVVWILDDDSRIDNLLYQPDSTVSKGNVEIITNIKRLRGYDIAIALGTVTGDPPLPFTSCIRAQLGDLYHNLEWMANLNPNETFPNRCSENMECRSNYHDYYYDLSRDETDQLETPFWYVPEKEGIEVKTAFINMIEALPSIKQGRQVFRPIIAKANVDPMQQMIPSVHRGGNTFVFHISSLRDYPNIVPNIRGKDTRRSDMVWCLLNRYITGRKVIEVPIPVRQDRSYIAEEKLDFNKLIEDIQGYAVYSSLQDVFLEKVKERQLAGDKTYGDELLNFNSEDIELALYKFNKYLNERTLAFELSYMRIVGLLRQFKKYTDRKNKNIYWWLNNGLYENTCKILQEFIESLNNEYKEKSLIEFRKKVENVDKEIIRSYFKQLKESVDRYKSNQPLITEEFIEFAENLIKNEFNIEELKLLGYGEESIVFTDGQRVFKYFYHWKKLITPEQKLFISSLVEKLKRYNTLYPIAEVRTWREHFCIVYPYEESTEYKGGYLDDIYLFLKECKDAGIVYRNVHPNNFIVTNTGLKLIDYGSDIHPFSDKEYNKMIRRAYLMYLYHEREDLKDLMHKSIKSINFPEFDRFKHFQRAIEPRTKEEILDSAIVYMVENINPKSVLDYGCGKGKISEKLCQDGLEVQAFDIDDNVITNNKSRKGNVRYYGPNEIPELINNDYKFDCIICNLVLCVIEDDDELREILYNIRNKIKDDGDVIITVCNPEDVLIQKTEIQQRILPENANLEDKFIFKKNILSTGNVRIDIHRTIDKYQEEFERMGLIVNNIHKTDGSDIENLVSASDFIIFHLEVNK